MKRREFITGLGSAAAWPVVARAQQPALPVIGILHGQSVDDYQGNLSIFRKGLSETGYVEEKNVLFEIRAAYGRNDRFPALAAELVLRRVSLIFTLSTLPAALAAKAATDKIPIVFSVGSDPIRDGLVPNLNRAGGNVTGVTYFSAELAPKRLEMLRTAVPEAVTIALLANHTNPNFKPGVQNFEAAARSAGQRIIVLSASTADEIDAAFTEIVRQQASALLVSGDALFFARLDQIVALAARYRIPASYFAREFAGAGGLMSYSDDRAESIRQAGVYAGRILKGEKPADLPVVQPTKFELVINLKTAKTLGLTVPETLLATADEVIQ